MSARLIERGGERAGIAYSLSQAVTTIGRA
jgi:hypothetical protein